MADNLFDDNFGTQDDASNPFFVQNEEEGAAPAIVPNSVNAPGTSPNVVRHEQVSGGGFFFFFLGG